MNYHKQYYLNNKEKLIQKQKKNYENNKEKLIEYQKHYYLDNKETIKKKKSEIINCQCGSKTRKDNISNHVKTKKHQTYLNNN